MFKLRRYIIENLKLNNGKFVPLLGYGTFLLTGTDKLTTTQLVAHAIKAGYRHIDTAIIYNNEAEVGDAIVESGIPRKEFFVTTKYFPLSPNLSEAYLDLTIERQLKKLKSDYIDLYLLHAPLMKNLNIKLWKILEKYYEKGILKNIGVSNYWRNNLEDLLEDAKVKPQMNQIQISPRYYPGKLIDYCLENDIALTAYSSFKTGELTDETINRIAKEKGKSAAQVVLRWAIQKKIVIIPKSATPSRIDANFDVFNFTLSSKDMEDLSRIRFWKGQIWNPDATQIYGGIQW